MNSLIVPSPQTKAVIVFIQEHLGEYSLSLFGLYSFLVALVLGYLANEFRKVILLSNETQPDLLQVWVGTFCFQKYGRTIEGNIKIFQDRIFTKKENNDWLYKRASSNIPNPSYISQIVAYGSKDSTIHIRYYGWNNTTHCILHLEDAEYIRYLVSAREILALHANSIQWSPHLLERDSVRT
jgi:hypothetical protein